MAPPRSLSAAGNYVSPGSTTSKGLQKPTLGPAIKAIRRPRKEIDSDDESVADEPRWSRPKENTPDLQSSPPAPSLGATPPLGVVKRHARQPSNFTSQVTPDKSKRLYQQKNAYSKEGSSLVLPQTPKLEFPQASLDDKVNAILTALPSPVRLTASNLQRLSETTTKRQAPLRPFELTSPTGIPAPRSVGSSASVVSDATSYARGGRRHNPSLPGDIKLYHLHRSDGQAPIKLYIRLVGEKGERVMVRVGGGWADLAEYLKEYATHHGSKRRVVSEGRIEIQDLGGAHHHTLHPSRSISSLRSVSPAPGSRSSSPAPGGRSRSASALGIRSSSAMGNRSSSAMGNRSSSAMGMRRAESPGPSHSPSRLSPPIMRGGHNGTGKEGPVTPTLTSFQPLTYQRPSGLSPPSGPSPPSRPGSSHSAVGAIRRSASRLSFTESAFDSAETASSADTGPPKPLGLAGPKGKKSVISPENQAWVEGMIGEVRKVSAHRRRRLTGGSNNGDAAEERETNSGDVVELQPGAGQQFGGRLAISDMGKQGGTRRVFPRKQM